MNDALEPIPLLRLALSFVPGLIALGFLFRWSAGAGTAVYGLGRMAAQLLLVGYVLAFVFEAESAAIALAILSVMLAAASWIALRPLEEKGPRAYVTALASIAAGGLFTLVLVTQGVLAASPAYDPKIVIPLGGMVFATSMNAVSLAAERFAAETRRGTRREESRRAALQAALIPIVNSLFAVGIVSLPGMMTGQILSGVSPLVAVRYQIMVMAMLFGTAALCAVFYLLLQRPAGAGSRPSPPPARDT